MKQKCDDNKNSQNILTDYNIYLFHQGKNHDSYSFLGSHFTKEQGRLGVRFTVWAPKAEEIRIVGDFNNWDGTSYEYSLKKITDKGLWSLFIAGIKDEIIYKYEVLNSENKKVLKSDPYARFSEKRPNTASKLIKDKKFIWTDDNWIKKRNVTNVHENPMNIYELHLGSWKRSEDGEFLNYRDIGKELSKYIKDMGYTHVEIMPLMEHPLDDSWGYQVTGYYSPTSRYGNIEDFKYMINVLHKYDIGVILDWVPGHFCKDEHGLYMFDGTPTYEYSDKSKAENIGWGAANFDLGKPEVKSFLISNALFWLREFHIDGFRVDAVANMLYLNYGRKEGEWQPNKNGGDENLEAVEFIKELNEALFKEFPSICMIAEESTSWTGVSKPTCVGGLGFNFKWSMGWMNDILKYVKLDPINRKNNHNLLNFSMMYHYSENFILPISHDEVVHGKKSLIDKMWGDYWNKFAGFRVFMVYMYTHPGKKTLFMGNEFAQFIEWRHYEELEWKLIEKFDMHKKTHNFVKLLNNMYIENRAFWKYDFKQQGFQWIDADNAQQSVVVFMRKSEVISETLIIVCNFTSLVYYDFKIGVPYEGEYSEFLNTDAKEFGGSGQIMGEVLYSKKEKWHNQPYCLNIKVPPMAALILKVDKSYKRLEENKKICVEGIE